jgi:hypothetical protein
MDSIKTAVLLVAKTRPLSQQTASCPQDHSFAMISLKAFLIIYFLGGITLVPLGVGIALFLIWLFHQHLPPLFHNKDATGEEQHILLDGKNDILEQPQPEGRHYRRGWIRIRTEFQPDDNSGSIMSGIQSYVSGKSTLKKRKEHYFALLKFGTLFLFDSENQSECKLVIPIHSYKASLYPEKLLDHEVYARPNAIKLTRSHASKEADKMTLASAPVAEQKKVIAEEEEFAAGDEFYIFCDKPVDKEDWFFAFLEASSAMPSDPTLPNIEQVDNTRFDQIALNQLIKTLQEDSGHRHAQWLNAIFGRIFLSVYKTDRINELIYHKVAKKARKVKRPGFVGEISVQNVTAGHSLPYITRPKLLSLSQSGELQAQANIHYAGSFRLEIATDITWSYSSMMKPIKVHVVLAVMLKKLTGKILVKIKAPPTNRLWIGFYEPPQMDWKIEPIVSDKAIKLSMVTNAIESKIREFMIENMVLPNMDDFPFFETDGLGGIFGEKIERRKSTKKQEADEANEVSQNVEKIAQDLHAESSTTPSTSSVNDSDENSVIYGDDQSTYNNRLSGGFDDLGGSNDSRSLPARSATDKDLLLPKDTHLAKNMLNDRNISRSAPNLLGQISISNDAAVASSDTATIRSFESAASEDTIDSGQEQETPKRWSSTLSKLKKHIIKDNNTDGDQGDHSGSEKSDDKSTSRLSDGYNDDPEKSRSRSSTLSNSEGRNRNSFISRMNGYLEQKLNEDTDIASVNTNTNISTEGSKRAAIRAMAGNLIHKGKENLQEIREKYPDHKSVQLLEKFSGKGRLRSDSSSSHGRSSVSSSDLPPVSPTASGFLKKDRSSMSHEPQADFQRVLKEQNNNAPSAETQDDRIKSTFESPAQQYKHLASEALGRHDTQLDPTQTDSIAVSNSASNRSSTPEIPSDSQNSKGGHGPMVNMMVHAPTDPTPALKTRPVPPPPVPPRASTLVEEKTMSTKAAPQSSSMQHEEARSGTTSERTPASSQVTSKKPPVPPRVIDHNRHLEKPALPPRDVPDQTQTDPWNRTRPVLDQS